MQCVYTEICTYKEERIIYMNNNSCNDPQLYYAVFWFICCERTSRGKTMYTWFVEPWTAVSRAITVSRNGRRITSWRQLTNALRVSIEERIVS